MLSIYADPQFIAAEVAYRRERLTGEPQRLARAAGSAADGPIGCT